MQWVLNGWFRFSTWSIVNSSLSFYVQVTLQVVFYGMLSHSIHGRIFTCICHKNQLNVGKYTIHGWYEYTMHLANLWIRKGWPMPVALQSAQKAGCDACRILTINVSRFGMMLDFVEYRYLYQAVKETFASTHYWVHVSLHFCFYPCFVGRLLLGGHWCKESWMHWKLSTVWEVQTAKIFCSHKRL